jgi:hypothetical protein
MVATVTGHLSDADMEKLAEGKNKISSKFIFFLLNHRKPLNQSNKTRLSGVFTA